MSYKNELNEKQYEAVCSKEQNLRIIAGAGSGKTRVLTYRIAYLIDEMKLWPFQILAITFTNKVAKEMKERTLGLIPNINASDLHIFTFHSWCANFLRREIDVLGIPSSFFIIDDQDQMSLLKNIGTDLGYKKTDEIIKEAYNFISKNKTLGQLPSDVEKNCKKETEKIYLNFFKEYEKRKSIAYYLDFDDLLIYSRKILIENSDIRLKYANRYKAILVDEFQDTNDLQYDIIKLLSTSSTKLYVVGDPDQTIYTWRGANQNIIINIDKDYYPMQTIVLDCNYRSTSSILNAANSLISNNQNRYKKNLFTNNGDGKKVSLNVSFNGIEESKRISETIKKIKRENPNVTYKDFAILYRSSYLSLKVENALTSANIPYKVYGGLKFYSRKEIKDCLAYFRLLMNEDDDISFERIYNVPRRLIGEKSFEILQIESKNNGLSMTKYVKSIHKYQTVLKSSVINKLTELNILMEKTRNKLVENLEAYSEILNDFLMQIGYYGYLQEKDETKDKIDNVKALIDDVRTYLKEHPESSFNEYLQNVTLLTSQDEIEGNDSVSLMTVHTAKGLEFPYVFVIQFAQGLFPNNRAVIEKSNGIEEERRLAYVAFTRAKKELYISYNRDYNYSIGGNNIPSQFIKEADLEPMNNNIYGNILLNGYNDKQKEKKYIIGSNNRASSYNDFNNKNDNFVDVTPNVDWKIGDFCFHKVFKKGKIINIEGDIATIEFDDFGIKKLMKNHPTLSKLGINKEEIIDDTIRS